MTIMYYDVQSKLVETFSLDGNLIVYENKVIRKSIFHSKSTGILPGNESNSHCNIHDVDISSDFNYTNDLGSLVDMFQVTDSRVKENTNFEYYILYPSRNEKVDKVIFLLHGFNEKNWEKYLSWGNELCDRTGSAVVFFPLAFHMQRAPSSWSDKKQMFELCIKRKEQYPNIVESSLINVESSVRLHYMPQRFIWSGLQSYYDIIQLIEEFKEGKNEHISPDFSLDFFAYSIGGLVAEILKLSNYKNYFTNTRVCLFCSGAVFNRMSAVSKFILDSEASVAMYSYLVEHFDVFIKKDPMLNHYFAGDHFEGKIFHSMLRYDNMRDFREELLKLYSKDFYAISLKNDKVIAPVEIINTLKGADRNIEIPVDVLDFPYKYSHENPFPYNTNIKETVDTCFKQVFTKATNFLNHND